MVLYVELLRLKKQQIHKMSVLEIRILRWKTRNKWKNKIWNKEIHL